MDESGSNSTPPPSSSERILHAARDEFEKYGYAGARVDRIAESANANKQLVYRYYGDKLSLYEAVIAHMIEVLEESNERSSERGIRRLAPSPEQLRGDGGIRGGWTRILSWEGLQPVSRSDAAGRFIRKNYDKYIEELERDHDAQNALARFPKRFVFALLLAADHIPYSTPDTFAAALGKESVSEADIAEWFEFVHDFVSSLPPAQDSDSASA